MEMLTEAGGNLRKCLDYEAKLTDVCVHSLANTSISDSNGFLTPLFYSPVWKYKLLAKGA